jgi:hypothetical protein
MKKLLLLLLLSVSSIAYGQITMKAVSVTIGTRAYPGAEMVFGNTDENLNIPVHVTEDDVIHIYSKEDQVYYKTSKSSTDPQGDLYWSAVDQDGDNCTMYLMTVDGATLLLIEFSNISWYYELQNY